MQSYGLAQALLLSILSNCLNAQQSCYLPDGSWDGGSETSPQPCNLLAGTSHCCGFPQVCLSNGYCYDPGAMSIYRSSCTDQTWKSTACPTYCNDGMLLFISSIWLYTSYRSTMTDILSSRHRLRPRTLPCGLRQVLLRYCHQFQLLQCSNAE